MLRYFKKSTAATTHTIDPNHLSEDEAEMLIALHQSMQNEHKGKIKLTLKPSTHIRQRQYAFRMPSLKQEGAYESHRIEVTSMIVILPTKKITPIHHSTNVLQLMEQLIQRYPHRHLLATHDPITNKPIDYLVPLPTAGNSKSHCFQLVQLTQNLVRYPRKKKPDENRYAIFESKHFSNGAVGSLHTSKYTLKFTSSDNMVGRPQIKFKNDQSKRRLVKLHYLPTDHQGHLQRLKYSMTLDRRMQNEAVIQETHFLSRDSFFHVKAPIVSFDNFSPAIIMRHAKGHELRAYLHNESMKIGIIPVDQRIIITIRLIEAVLGLHAKSIIHRDLKPENILLDTDDHLNPTFVKIIDYGLSCYVQDEDTFFCGTYEYVPPDIYKGIPADELSDTYSFMTMLRIDLWDNMEHPKFDDLSDLHKVAILAAILRGTQEERLGRATLQQVLAVFQRIRDERDDLREVGEQFIGINPARRH